jgi:hypothetical protein
MPRKISARERERPGREIADRFDQAAGGARERKARRSGGETPRETLTEWLIRSKPSGTGNAGGVETNEVETKKIDAHIGQ